MRWLEEEFCTHAFHGFISLHADDTSHGVYGFVSGATLTQHLLKPALAAAEQLLPRNESDIIDGFQARHGIIVMLGNLRLCRRTHEVRRFRDSS